MKFHISVVAASLLLATSAFAFTDTNDNGIMDSWESKYALSTANGDSDGDGLTNLQEFVRQSDPTVKDAVGTNLAKVKSVDTNGTAYSLATYGDNIVVADGSYGLAVYDKDYNYISGLKIGLTSATAVFVKGAVAFVQNSSQVQVVDLSDTNNPKIIKTLGVQIDGYTASVARIYIKENSLY